MPLDSAEIVLPEGVSLEQYCPRPRNQGDQNSCVAWSIAYAAQTIIRAQAEESDPNKVAFSPSFLFNLINFNRCEGAYIPNAMDKIRRVGLVNYTDFAYNDAVCDKQPSTELLAAAKPFRIAGYSRLTKSKTDYTIDTVAIKQCLAQGMPVVIGALVTPSFEDLTEKVWQPDADEGVIGGHAMCVVGYNDAVEGGAFRLLNSWGTDWADGGFVWVRYADFMPFCKEAYVVQPLARNNRFEVQMSWLNTALQPMALSQKAAVFVPELATKTGEMQQPDRLMVSNKTKQYFYVLSQQEGGKASVVFPATQGESAYLGLCGKHTLRIATAEKTDADAEVEVAPITVAKEASIVDSAED